MPVSYRKEDAATGGSSFKLQAGVNYIVRNAVSTVVQYPKKGAPRNSNNPDDMQPPRLIVRLTCEPLNDKWKPVEGEPIEADFGLGGKAMDHFQVGKMSGPNDSKEKLLGQKVGIEGNCISLQPDVEAQLHEKCGFMMFVASLEELGWNPAISKRGYLPDFVGLQFTAALTEKQKMDDGGEFQQVIAKAVNKWPYDDAKPAQSGSPKPDKTSEAASAAASASADTTNAAGDDDAVAEKVQEILGGIAAKMSGKSKAISQLEVSVRTALVSANIKGADQKPYIAYFKANGADLLAAYGDVNDAGEVTFN